MAVLDNMLLTESAYILKKEDGFNLSNTFLKSFFREISADRKGNYLLNKLNQEIVIAGTTLKYSICIFRLVSKPSFFMERVEGWDEVRIAYFLIVDYEEYVAVSKKNIHSVKELWQRLEPLGYKVLSSMFVLDSTAFEKFSLRNTNISDRAIRQKVLEANNLKETFNTFGAGKYVLDHLRFSNDEDRFAVAFNVSKIGKLGSRSFIEDFVRWGKGVIDKVRAFSGAGNYLDIFAEQVSYETYSDQLNPIAILFVFSRLNEELESGKIVRCFYRHHTDRPINIMNGISRFNKLCQIENNEGDLIVRNTATSDLYIKKNRKSITVESEKLRNVYLQYDDGGLMDIIAYINYKNAFIVNFDNLDLVYTTRQLFKDARLINTLDLLLQVFTPFEELADVTSEKGDFVLS